MGTGNAGSASVGVGPGNDRQGGAQDQDGSQRASGGSGGSQLTRSLEDTGSAGPAKVTGLKEEGDREQSEPAAAGSAMTASTRGPQDTHSHQAGSTATGLGAPETGANQKPADLAPKK